MHNDDWFMAYSPEVPGANGQGHTADEARAELVEAIAAILGDRDAALKVKIVVEQLAGSM